MKIGAKPKPIKLLPHQTAWLAAFAREAKRIERASPQIHVHHIGSTAIPGISAKPIIDILAGVAKVKDFHSLSVALRQAGYTPVEDVGDPRYRRFFVKKSREKGILVEGYHLHLIKYRGQLWKAHTAFPRYLREKRKAARQYDKLKRRLASQYKNDRWSYGRAKGPFIRKIIRQALPYYAHKPR